MRRGNDLRVAVDARLVAGSSGGVESMVMGLVSGLSSLTDGDERYEILVRGDASEWIAPFIAGRASLLPISSAVSRWRHRAKRAAGPFASGLVEAWRRRPILPGGAVSGPPPSDGTIERAGVEVVHFTFQKGFRTDVPSIYHPHDLQHMHLPEFFSARERSVRDRWYRELAMQAALVAVTSSWVRDDVVRMLGIPEERVQVVPWAPILHAYPVPTADEVDAVRTRFGLPDQFLFYPAQTWPHKNHAALLDAVEILGRRERLRVPLVFSGRQTSHAQAIRRRARRLGITELVHWTGFVRPVELQALYRLARAVVIPTRFEAASGPLWEAFLAGVPAACSNVTSLPAQAGDAAILFDPDDIDGIASAIQRLWTDARLRNELVRRGRANVNRFSWDHTARLFRAHYRRIAGRPLGSDDVALLDAPPLL
jgi:glycosyltransferase involved in cell wall biosynthesis